MFIDVFKGFKFYKTLYELFDTPSYVILILFVQYYTQPYFLIGHIFISEFALPLVTHFATDLNISLFT